MWAARLRISTDKKLGKPTPPWVFRLAREQRDWNVLDVSDVLALLRQFEDARDDARNLLVHDWLVRWAVAGPQWRESLIRDLGGRWAK